MNNNLCCISLSLSLLPNPSLRRHLAAPGHAGNADGPRQVGPRHRETYRGGTGEEIRLRGGVLRGDPHVVAEAQASDVVTVRRTLLLCRSQGTIQV